MFVTNVLLKKVKAKLVRVLMQSTASDFQTTVVRPKADGKAELVLYDPHIFRRCVFREERKLKSIKSKGSD